MAVLSLDLGGTKLSSAFFSEEGRMSDRIEVPIEGRKAGRRVRSAVQEALERAARRGESVSALGMCVPGIYRRESGTVWAPNIPGWDDYPLRDELMETADFPVGIDSDRSCCILGEIWKGAAQRCSDAVFVSVGTGIGAGIVSGGRVIDGRHGIAGAIGWMALDRPYQPRYDACGCFEHQASGDGLARMADELRPKGYAGSLPVGADGRAVFEAFERGDDLAAQVVDNAVELLGMAVANLVSLLNPEKIIFGGGVFGPAAPLLGRIRREAEQWAQPISMQEVILEISRLGPDAGLYGAARLALDQHGT